MDVMDEDYDAPLFEHQPSSNKNNASSNNEKKDDSFQQKLIAPSEYDISDSEDEALSSIADRDQFEGLNLPSRLKDILLFDRSETFGNDVMRADESDSDIDTTPLLLPHTNKMDINKLNEKLTQDKTKFANFPLMRPNNDDDDDNENDNRTVKKKPKNKSTPETKKKKKRRRRPTAEEKGKERMDVLNQADERRRTKLEDLLNKFREEESEDSYDSDAIEADINARLNGPSKKQRGKPSTGRKTRKKTTNIHAVDENGERVYRKADLLNDTSSSEEDETQRKLSKKQEMEMYREAERRRRMEKISLKPVYNIKSYDELIKRHDEKEQQYIKQQEMEKLKKAQPQQQAGPNQDDSDSDIEIINKPSILNPSVFLSPERARFPLATGFSPVRHVGSSVLRQQNQELISRIINQGYQQRMKLEQQARARGQYVTPTERARQLLEKEKNARLINEEVKKHLEKQKQQQENYYENDDDDEEMDGDYIDDSINNYSEAEDDDDVKFRIEDADEVKRTNNSSKSNRKFNNINAESEENNKKKDESVPDNDSEDEEDSMAVAFRRWKGKKVKKSTLFDDDDDDSEDENKPVSKKAPLKPEPAHSIVNFFKAKEKQNSRATEDYDRTKPLNRLIRRNSEETAGNDAPVTANEIANIMDEADTADDMDIDASDENHEKSAKPVSKPNTIKPKFNLSKNEYFEAEAEEEEDEYFGVAGEDEEEGEDLDEYEKDDLLVEDNNEQIDEAALREAFNKQDKESDENMISRLITDITSGGLRKQKAAAAAGLLLEDVELYDDDDLVAIRRAAEARRRRMMEKKGGDTLENLSNDPKTAAFAKAAEPIADTVPIVLSDDEDGEDAKEENKDEEKNADEYQDEDEDEDMEESEDIPAPMYRRRIISDDEEDDDEEQQELLDVENGSTRQPHVPSDFLLNDTSDDSDDEKFAIVDLNDTNATTMQKCK
ncbi:MRC1-like domain-containing protein [Mycotypha africana]|uniref:MRC1-like domain-containing protein n=1 Tax=Mycotypha africana TaxID=64632 RepID=UPI0023019737|nr:MRC1-like domain-containing protein [Mycotypha africana]KAI8969305.1 MRC1-like domain-containing protein [Mycotypha africana]